jgi:hypothetical protein
MHTRVSVITNCSEQERGGGSCMYTTARSLHCKSPPAAKPLGGWNHLTPYSSAILPSMAVRVFNGMALFQIAGMNFVFLTFLFLLFLCDILNDAVGSSGYNVECQEIF